MGDEGVKLNSQPRIESIDALRGFALIGVGLVHMLEQFAAAAPLDAIREVATAGTLDQVIAGLNQVFMVGKFYLIFSLLFGLSFCIQIEGRDRHGEPLYGRFAWRLALLFGFGFLHHLFHRGDILMLYAILGFSLLLLHHLSTRALIVLAFAMFLGLGRFLSLALLGDAFELTKPDSPENRAYYEVLLNGSLRDVFAVNLATGWQGLLAFQFGVVGRAYVTFGLFLVGLALGRSGFFGDLAANRTVIIRALRWAGVGCVVSVVGAGAVFSQIQQPVSFSSWPMAFGLTFVDLFNLSLATVFSCLFLLAVLSPRWERLTGVLAPYGRMALSNYLLQGLIGTALLYGWGFGQLGNWTNRQLLVAGVTLALAQVMASRLWMRHFLYGPFEWLWRSLTLRRRIAIRRPAVSAGQA